MRAIQWIVGGLLLAAPATLCGCDTDRDDTLEVERTEESIEEAGEEIEDSVD